VTPPVVVLDACVLYPAPLRDLFMNLAVAGLIHARWTNNIHEEWMRNVLTDRPDLTRAQLERTRDLMNVHAPESLVQDFESLIPTLTLPDPDDRHVLAAAIKASASAVITFNLSDFRETFLRPYRIAAKHPDAFACEVWDTGPEVVREALHQHRLSLHRPPKTAAQYIETLERSNLPRFALRLRPYEDEI
jgi:predicted nucleic acid-binding protein